MGLYRDRKTDLHMVFIDPEKAYDQVPHEVVWKGLQKTRVSPLYSQLLRICTRKVGRVLGCQDGSQMTSSLVWACIRVQDSALSPFVFTIVMDVLTRGIQHELPWYMLFADDIILIDETRQGVNDKLE